MQVAASQKDPDSLPPDVWAAVAKAALAAEGDSLAIWLRLGMVSRSWRDILSGSRLPHQCHKAQSLCRHSDPSSQSAGFTRSACCRSAKVCTSALLLLLALMM